MNPDHLRRLEDLTRRYAKHRPCGAGLGTLWGGMVYGFFAGMVLGWVLGQVVAFATRQSFAHTLFHSQVGMPPLLVGSAIAAPWLIWVGVLLVQRWVDQRFGKVVGEPRDSFQLPRWFLSGFVVLIALLNLSLSIFDHHALFQGAPDYRLNAWKVGGMLAIGLLALWWGRAGQDEQTRTLMMLCSIPSLFALNAGPADLFILSFTSAIYLALMFAAMVKGALRFASFMKVRQELSAIQPEAG